MDTASLFLSVLALHVLYASLCVALCMSLYTQVSADTPKAQDSIPAVWPSDQPTTQPTSPRAVIISVLDPLAVMPSAEVSGGRPYTRTYTQARKFTRAGSAYRCIHRAVYCTCAIWMIVCVFCWDCIDVVRMSLSCTQVVMPESQALVSPFSSAPAQLMANTSVLTFANPPPETMFDVNHQAPGSAQSQPVPSPPAQPEPVTRSAQPSAARRRVWDHTKLSMSRERVSL